MIKCGQYIIASFAYILFVDEINYQFVKIFSKQNLHPRQNLRVLELLTLLTFFFAASSLIPPVAVSISFGDDDEAMQIKI